MIGWPIDFRHNFLYVASTLVEAVMFTQVANPPRWFAVGAVFSSMVWLIFALDRRLIRRRFRATPGTEAGELQVWLRREQTTSVRLWMPATILFYVVAAGVSFRWPDWAVAGHGHLVFATLQLAGAAANLLYVVRFFTSISGLIEAVYDR